MGRLTTPREDLIKDLLAYGEDGAAKKVVELNEADFLRLEILACNHAVGEVRLLSKALALAAIEVIEGKPRPLKRKRRRMNAYDL